MTRREVELLGLTLLFLGCAAATPRILTAEDCQYTRKPAVLIKNPQATPAWVWVAEDQIPTSGATLLFGKRSLLASPEVVAAHPPPPCGLPISRLHLGEYPAEDPTVGFLGTVGQVLQILGPAF